MTPLVSKELNGNIMGVRKAKIVLQDGKFAEETYCFGKIGLETMPSFAFSRKSSNSRNSKIDLFGDSCSEPNKKDIRQRNTIFPMLSNVSLE